MPQCSCFRDYELTVIAQDDYKLAVAIEGNAGYLKDILEKAKVAQSVSVEKDVNWQIPPLTNFVLSKVSDKAKLCGFLELLKSRIIVDLSKARVDECYALAPYTVFDEQDNHYHTMVGELINEAKYRKDEAASAKLCEELKAFIASHPRLRSCEHIAAAPKSDTTTPDLAGRWAQDITAIRGWQLVQVTKVRQTAPQKNNPSEQDTEEDVAARVAGSMKVGSLKHGANVVMLDDSIRSGGTMMELARVLHEAGADRVFGLSAAKDAKYTLGGIYLKNWEQWRER